MVNYNNSKIYKIVDNTNGNIYIGSTTQKTLARRLSGHVYDTKININNSSSSKQIINNGDYKIILIENFPCNSKDELHARERHYIETMDCINKIIPMRTKAEYYQCNKEYIIQKQTKYSKENTEKIKKYQADYREKNKEYIKQHKAEWYQKNKNKANENNI